MLIFERYGKGHRNNRQNVKGKVYKNILGVFYSHAKYAFIVYPNVAYKNFSKTHASLKIIKWKEKHILSEEVKHWKISLSQLLITFSVMRLFWFTELQIKRSIPVLDRKVTHWNFTVAQSKQGKFGPRKQVFTF